ncbi:MAG: hypothetical protein P8046_01450 [Anaerolineales bacterium]
MEKKMEMYKEKAQARYDQYSAKIDELLAKFNETKADTKLKFENQFEDLTNQRQTVADKLDQMKDMGEDAWEEMRSGMDSALDDLEKSYQKTTEKLEQAT